MIPRLGGVSSYHWRVDRMGPIPPPTQRLVHGEAGLVSDDHFATFLAIYSVVMVRVLEYLCLNLRQYCWGDVRGLTLLGSVLKSNVVEHMKPAESIKDIYKIFNSTNKH